MHELFYATTNTIKFQEADHCLQNTLAARNIRLQQYKEDISEPQTLDQEYVAIAKAREAWNRLEKPVLAEDAGIYFAKYNQFPGTLTKFIYHALGMRTLLQLIDAHDAAYFQMHLVYWYGPEQYQIFKGICSGVIVKPEFFNASTSVPFDDIFMPDGSDKTYAQLRECHQLYHFNYRVKALEQFARWYENHYTSCVNI